MDHKKTDDKIRSVEEICEQALPTGTCAATNQNIKIRRAWLKREIEKLLTRSQRGVGPTEFKN